MKLERDQKGLSQQMTSEELKKAFSIWDFHNNNTEVNQLLVPFLQTGFKSQSPPDGWLKSARKAMQLSSSHVANRMNMAQASQSLIEKSEQDGTISLRTLAKASEAMNCELVYGIRPKQRVLFSQLIWNQILPHALEHPWIRKCDPNRKAQALAAIAQRLMKDSQFRRDRGWSQRVRNRDSPFG